MLETDGSLIIYKPQLSFVGVNYSLTIASTASDLPSPDFTIETDNRENVTIHRGNLAAHAKIFTRLLMECEPAFFAKIRVKASTTALNLVCGNMYSVPLIRLSQLRILPLPLALEAYLLAAQFGALTIRSMFASNILYVYIDSTLPVYR